jgi:SAM-dependent methyltransferase
MDLIKKNYADWRRNLQPPEAEVWNRRLFQTYNEIAIKLTGRNLQGKNVDLGCGNNVFSLVCQKSSIESWGFDYPDFDLEKDTIPFANYSIDFITMNAVIEHINNPKHILMETKRILKKNGLFFIRTPNWQLDFKNFYNNQDHVRPYTSVSLKKTLEYSGFSVMFLEPGLIKKSWLWWKLPEFIKWRAASYIKGGTKSILAVAQK